MRWHEADVVSGLGSDGHEGGFDVPGLEDVENLWSPLGIGAVVEGERNLVGMVAVLLDGVGVRIDVHVLIDDELLARVGLVGIHFDGALAGLRQAGDAQNVAFALGVHVMARLRRCPAPAASPDCWAGPRCSTANCPLRPGARGQRSAGRAGARRASRRAAVTASRNQTTWR